ncbi:MAG: GerMN domain-containing protein [Armatimonadetes bacterium]|nr:GerMN domain-containing protein [Armatimonadota bacterium]MDW8121063.1 GerMN domain-containing protein [Armatimonadota bacterium]
MRVWFVLGAVVGVVGLLVWLIIHKPQPTRRVGPVDLKGVGAAILYFPDIRGDRLISHSVSDLNQEWREKLTKIIALLTDPPRQGLEPALPPGTRLLSANVTGKVLVLNFNRAFLEPSFWVGSEVAHLRFQALVYTVTGLTGTQSVQILVDGQTPPALGGHIELSEPVKRDPTIIP